MEQLMHDEKLTIIKAFHTYLGEIIDNGYNNDYETLLIITKHINNYQEDIINPSSNEENTFNYEYNLSSSSSSSSAEEDNNSQTTTEDEEDNEDENINNTDSEIEAERLQKEKELNKIKKFFDGPDLSKIYLYNKNNKFVKNMESFIKKSYLY
jgi:hypothetical protein